MINLFSRRKLGDADIKCKQLLIETYNCTEEDAQYRTEEIKKICIDVMEKLMLTQIKIETKADLINLIKQYNIVSNAKIIEYFDKEFGENK